MVQYMTMKMVNIFEAKAKLSEYVEAAASGERVVICKRNQPVAELRAVPSARTAPRPIGGAAGRLHVPAAFFEPLPEEVVSSFFPGKESGSPRKPRR
jgi:antitoxin (DNA-binding transcriptional repressor) of toxin-antitoxin stability system